MKRLPISLSRLLGSSKRRFAAMASVAAVATAGIVLVGSVVSASGDECTPTWPLVVWHADPAHEAVISWTTIDQGSSSVVHYDTQSHAGVLSDYAMTISDVQSGGYDDGGQFYHHGVLDNLEPSTRYYFVVETDGEVSEERYFVTAPEDDRPIRLLYGGDSRSNAESRQGMNDRIKALVEEDPGTIALVHGGDYINDGDSWGDWSEWLEDHQRIAADDGRMLPIVPARGNHEDGGEIYNQVFGFPAGDAEINYWTLEIGPQLRFIQLDSNVSHGGDQRDFLEAELQAAQSSRWILANYHRPAYPAVKSPGDALVNWVPLFEEYNVNLVCESDGHALKRTVPIRAGEMNPDGVVYVGEGGLGVNQRIPINAFQWYLQPPGMTMAGHHVQRLSIGPDAIVYEAILMNGTVTDSYTAMPNRDGTVVLPEFTDATADGSDYVEVTLSKDMDPARLADAAAYSIDGGTVESVEVIDERTVALTTAPLPEGVHTLSGIGLTDLAGNEVAGPIDFNVGPDGNPGGDDEGDDAGDGGDADGDGDGGDAGTGGADGDGGSASGSGSAGGEDDESDGSGCGCRGGGSAPTSLFGLLLGFALVRRRQR